MAQIQPEDIERYKAHRRKFVKESTVNRDLARLKTLLNKAVANGLIAFNP